MRVILAIAVATTTLLAAAQSALGSTQQLAMFADDVHLQADPAGTLDTFRQLGVGIARVYVKWSAIAPSAKSAKRPAGLDASDPGSYPAANWATFDEIVRDAVARRIAIDFTLGGGAPRWAVGRRRSVVWKPSAREYGAFVHAVATRYSGSYTPAGSSFPLPAVRFFEVWNEPNFGPELAPQATRGSTVPVSPRVYRGLLDAAWSALQATGHGRDTILFGSLAARGSTAPSSRRVPDGRPGTYGTTKPLRFLRALYCVDSGHRELRGATAAATGCPTNAAASRRFRALHPALFKASGFAAHPYPIDQPPDQAGSTDPNFTEFSELPGLGRELDRLQRIYRSGTRFPIYVTEYGYITNPPNRSNHFVSPATAAFYTNWAEYLSYRNPRIQTTMQYLLYDPNPRRAPDYGGFASGLIFYGGAHKPGYDAYRLPLFLPVTSTRAGRALTVWGCVRPAHFVRIDTGGMPQAVQIQFRRGSTGTFATVMAAPITNPRGYFDVRVPFGASGSVRLAWTDSSGTSFYSRVQRITVK